MSTDYTLVMAVKNGENLIAETLESVTAQTLQAKQIILVIDHATDNTVEFARSVADDIEIHFSEKHGVIPAMNLGIDLATSEYVAFLDHDDLWTPTKQAMQIEILNQKPSIDVVSSATRNFSKVTVEGIEQQVERDFASTRAFSSSTFRRDCFERFGKLDESLTHFQWLYGWWSHASSMNIQVENLEEIHLLRRIHESNSWVTHAEAARHDVLETIRRHMNRAT